MRQTLAGKNVVITGASKGLGRALAVAFARAGTARLALIARTEDLLREVKQLLVKEAPKLKVLTIGADLSNEADIERAVALTLHEFGGRRNGRNGGGPMAGLFELKHELLAKFRLAVNNENVRHT